MTSSLTPPSAANRICARFSLRAACLPPASSPSSSTRSAWFNSTRYRTFITDPPWLRAVMKNQSATDSRPRFTAKQGQYLAFIHAYRRLLGRSPAEADLQSFFLVTPPSVHQMVLSLEKAGLITRVAGKPRSIQLAIDPADLPKLISRYDQPVKTSVQSY